MNPENRPRKNRKELQEETPVEDDFDEDETEDEPAPDEVSIDPSKRTPYRNRSLVIQVKRLTQKEIERGRLLYPEMPDDDRPMTRGDCENTERPCPYVSCRHHLAIDVSSTTGSIKVNQPGLELKEMLETCSLDVADQGGKTLEEVGEIMNLTRERVRQLETKAFRKLKKLGLPSPADFEGDAKNKNED